MLASPLETPVAGVSFRNDYPSNIWKISGAMIEDKPLRAMLVREPDNPNDCHAIKVVIDDEHIGYIPALIAHGLSKEIDSGVDWVAVVDRIVVSPQNTDQPGLRLKVVKQCQPA